MNDIIFNKDVCFLASLLGIRTTSAAAALKKAKGLPELLAMSDDKIAALPKLNKSHVKIIRAALYLSERDCIVETLMTFM